MTVCTTNVYKTKEVNMIKHYVAQEKVPVTIKKEDGREYYAHNKFLTKIEDGNITITEEEVEFKIVSYDFKFDSFYYESNGHRTSSNFHRHLVHSKTHGYGFVTHIEIGYIYEKQFDFSLDAKEAINKIKQREEEERQMAQRGSIWANERCQKHLFKEGFESEYEKISRKCTCHWYQPETFWGPTVVGYRSLPQEFFVCKNCK